MTTTRSIKAKRARSKAGDMPARKPIPVSSELLLEMAKKCPPTQSWFEEPDILYTPAKRKTRK